MSNNLVKFRNVVAAAALVLAAHQVAATPVSFTGSGGFTNIQNCSGGAIAGCSIMGGGTILDMSGYNYSTLTAVTTSNTVQTDTNDTLIGEIRWVNNASYYTDQNFLVNYTFTLAFTQPSNQSDSQIFNLRITQPTNPTPDYVFNLSNATLGGLGPFTLAGVTVSDIHFGLINPLGSYNGSTWTNPENTISRLGIYADFTATSVPEPGTLAMLGIGLLGLGLVRRKKA